MSFLDELTCHFKIILLLFNLERTVYSLVEHLLRYYDLVRLLSIVLELDGLYLQNMVEHYTRYCVQIMQKTELHLPWVLVGAGLHLGIRHGHVLVLQEVLIPCFLFVSNQLAYLL